MSGYRRGVCIFIDILGTRDNSNFDEKYRIHKIFHEEANEIGANQSKHTVFDRKVISFSDCAYHLYFYKDDIPEDRKNDNALLHTALANTTNSIIRFYHHGILTRGGACFGEFYIDDLGFFGPAIELSYNIESKCAKMPRLLISGDAGKGAYDYEREDIDPNAWMFNPYESYFIEKEGDDYILNEFCQLERGGINFRTETVTLASAVHRIMIVAQSTIDTSKDTRVIEKNNYILQRAKSRIQIIKQQITAQIEYAASSMPDIIANLSPDEVIRVVFHNNEDSVRFFLSNEELHEMISQAINYKP